jgi:hypothetical protein
MITPEKVRAAMDATESVLEEMAYDLAQAYLALVADIENVLKTLEPFEKADLPYVGPIADVLRDILGGGGS